MRLVQSHLQSRHGQAVRIDYVDLGHAGAQAQFAGLVAEAEQHSLPYPLVTINGQLRLAGPAYYYQVLPLIDEMLAQRSTSLDE